ncbi:hypothetical protein JCM11641_002094 [Rhodosporidiobolus odoratus]
MQPASGLLPYSPPESLSSARLPFRHLLPAARCLSSLLLEDGAACSFLRVEYSITSSTISDQSSLSPGLASAHSSNSSSINPPTPSSSSDSSSDLSSVPPIPRRSPRGLRSPSFGPSDLDTFVSAQRSIARSVRFNSLPAPMSDASSSSRPRTADTDPVDVWAGKDGTPPGPSAPPPVPSVAGSRVSVGSTLRRQQAADAYERERAARIQAFMDQEEALKAQVEVKLKLEDEQSEVANGLPQPALSAQAGEDDVICRRLASLAHERAALERILVSRGNALGGQPQSVRPTRLVASQRVGLPILEEEEPVRLATIGVKVKADKPKPWTGKYEWQERESWIKSASLYLVSLEMELDARIDELLTPQPFYIVRSLFSSDTTHGSPISPQAWFDSRNRRHPFTSVQDIFKALRSHWADDHAAEVALQRYRAARQGSLRARDFGSSLDSLADACIDRVIDDLDRRTTFVQGLNPVVQDFVKTQLASRKALGKLEVAPSAASRASNWIDAAVLWQTEHPLGDHLRWSDPKARSPSKSIRCYNCGELSTHYSKACPASRKDPKVVVLAALAKLSSTVPSSASSVPPVPSPSTPSVSSANRFELLADEEGKEDEDSTLPSNECVTDGPSPEIPTRPSGPSKAKGKTKKKAKSLPPPPPIAKSPLTVPSLFTSSDGIQVKGISLVDSGAQADVLSPLLAHQLGLPVRRLVAPVHADLAAEGQQVRLSLFAVVDIMVGGLEVKGRSCFVCPLPPGTDAILGVPWLRDTGTAVSASKLFVAPTGPSRDVYDFEKGVFVDQPARNLLDLGYTDRAMGDNELSSFILCALSAGVEPSLVAQTVESIELEPHNPLLDDEDDDPKVVEISEEEAKVQLAALLKRFDDIFVDELPGPPPFRPINHEILLKEADKKVRPFAIGIPERYKAQWTAHLRKFVETGFWSPTALDSACSMFAVPKHDKSQARFVVNLKPRNENMVPLASPIPDMKDLRNRFASNPSPCVPLSGFVTPNGTFISHVMQQGDRNAPDTMHRVCYLMFAKAIGRFLDVFYDDVLIYSKTRRAHLRYLDIVFTTLRHYKFYLSRSKVEFMVPRIDALGAVIDDEEIHVSQEKWEMVKKWPTPKSPKDILRFMGTVQWMADHLPRLNEIAAPLTCLTSKVDFVWSPACDFAFDLLKSLVPKTLKPLDLGHLEDESERLYLFTDASIYGCGGWLGQGASRESARPVRFFSSKFNSAQRNYSTTDQESLGVFVGVRKMHEQLVGWRFVVVCDHEPLKTYWTQPPKQTRRHVRLWEVLAQYDIVWEFVPGKNNTLADSLSRLAEIEGLDGIDLPVAEEPVPAEDNSEPFSSSLTPRVQFAMARLVAAVTTRLEELKVPLLPSPSIMSATVLTGFAPPFVASLREASGRDPLAGKILANYAAYPSFTLVDGLLFHLSDSSRQLVVPAGSSPSTTSSSPVAFTEAVLQHCHLAVGHLGFARTLAYVRRYFWWRDMVKDTEDYVKGCEPCARNKSATTRPYGLLHPLPVPSGPWSMVGMDFVVGLPLVPFHGRLVDSILTVTDYLSRMVVLIPMPSTSTAPQVADDFHSAVYRRFGLPSAMVSDRDPNFNLSFWRALHAKLGSSLKMSTAAHPQTDGRAEATNKSVGQILPILAEDNHDDWPSLLVATEFALNASSPSTSLPSPFDIVHGFLPRSLPPVGWDPSNDIAAEGFAERSRLNALKASDAIIAARIATTHQENKHRRDDAGVFSVGDKAYISTAGMKMPKEVAGKFVPKFIGPFSIVAADFPSSTYTFDLPPHLRVHRRFHASKLRRHFLDQHA